MRKRAAIEFSLRWDSSYATHNDRLFIEKVDFWRDIFPGSMGEPLAETVSGNSHAERFEPGELVPEFRDSNLVTFKKSEVSTSKHLKELSLEPGRYYPKGYFWKPLSSFPTDQTPVRLVSQDSTSFVVDTNHPLARYPLQVKARVHQSSSKSAQRGGSLHDIGQLVTTGGPGMQAPVGEVRLRLSDGSLLPRENETDDLLYYRTPRLVHHLDATARSHVRDKYGQLLKPHSSILDLMSSWESHIPESLHSCRIDGLGLNMEELQANKRLSGRLIHDLNRDPVLPLKDSSFDAAICTVSIEYLSRPLEVLSEIARILKPGGILVITVSERWFPGKQVKKWADLHPFERQGAVMGFLLDLEAFTDIHTESIRGYPRPVDDKYSDHMSNSDSLYFIWAHCVK